MRLNQYLVEIPVELFRSALSISDAIIDITPAQRQGGDKLVFIVQANKPLKKIDGKMVSTVELKTIQKKKRKPKKRVANEKG